MELNDQEILTMIKNSDGSHYGFSLLVKKYQKKLYAVIRRMLISHADTDDVLQDVFIKVWRGLPQFNEQAQLYTWIYRIAVNETLTKLKQKKMRYFLPIVDVENELSNLIDNTQEYTGDEIQKKLQKAVLSLPEKQRMVFHLKYFEELKFKEIAEIMNVSEGGLKAQYHHAVKKIEDYLQLD